jgi:iron complex outermembrane receptor protein
MYNNVESARAEYNLLLNSSVLANVPRGVLDSNFNVDSEVIYSDYFIENASFLKMDNITLGYTFQNVIKNSSNSSVRITCGVQNVFTVTNYSGLDPEIFSGIDNTIYPRPRTYLLGANMRF